MERSIVQELAFLRVRVSQLEALLAEETVREEKDPEKPWTHGVRCTCEDDSGRRAYWHDRGEAY
jgi:hypothetical protein